MALACSILVVFEVVIVALEAGTVELGVALAEPEVVVVVELEAEAVEPEVVIVVEFEVALAELEAVTVAFEMEGTELEMAVVAGVVTLEVVDSSWEYQWEVPEEFVPVTLSG